MDRDEIDVLLKLCQRVAHGFSARRPAYHSVDSHDRQVGTILGCEEFAIFLRDDDDQLLDVLARKELLSRMQPHGPSFQRRERFLVVVVFKSRASSRSGEDDGKTGHKIPFQKMASQTLRPCE